MVAGRARRRTLTPRRRQGQATAPTADRNARDAAQAISGTMPAIRRWLAHDASPSLRLVKSRVTVGAVVLSLASASSCWVCRVGRNSEGDIEVGATPPPALPDSFAVNVKAPRGRIAE